MVWAVAKGEQQLMNVDHIMLSLWEAGTVYCSVEYVKMEPWVL